MNGYRRRLLEHHSPTPGVTSSCHMTNFHAFHLFGVSRWCSSIDPISDRSRDGIWWLHLTFATNQRIRSQNRPKRQNHISWVPCTKTVRFVTFGNDWFSFSLPHNRCQTSLSLRNFLKVSTGRPHSTTPGIAPHAEARSTVVPPG